MVHNTAIEERSGLVERVVEYLRSGFDVNVVSAPGNGGSWFLHSLQAGLEEGDTEVVFLPRVGEQIPIPSAFTQFLEGNTKTPTQQPARTESAEYSYASPKAVRNFSTVQLVAHLARRVGNRPLVVIAENPQALTPTLRTVLTMYRQQARVNVIALSSQAQHRLIEDSSVIMVTLPTLSLDAIRNLLHAKLGAPLEPATLGRVYAKSGGLVAIAVSICEAARIERKLHLVDGEWAAKSNLWSDALIPLMMRYIEELEPEEIAGLETLAHARTIEMEKSKSLIGVAVLERLELQGIVVSHQAQDRRWMSINPPLLQEMLLQTTPQARLGLPASAETISDSRIPQPTQSVHYRTRITPIAPSFLNLLARHKREELREAALGFRANATRENSLRYTAAMVGERVDPQEILAVIAEGMAAPGSDYHLAELTRWKAWLYGYCLHDIDKAEEILLHPENPVDFQQMLGATRIEMLLDLAQVPTDAAEYLRMDDSTAEEAWPVICHTLAAVHLNAGRPDKAAETLSLIAPGQPGVVDHTSEVLSGFVALELGDFERAFEIAYCGFERAMSELDEASLREHAHLLTLLLLIRGRSQEIVYLRELFDALGGPPLIPSTEYLGAIVFAIISARSVAEVKRMLKELEELRLPGGVMRSVYEEWGQARIAALEGARQLAAEACWRSAETLHKHGLVATAILSGTRSLDHRFDEDRYLLLKHWVVGVHSEYLLAYLEFVVAEHRADCEALITVLPRLAKTGRIEQTVRAYEQVILLLRGSGQIARAEQFERDEMMFLDSLEPGTHRAGKMEPVVAHLTEREREVAQLLVQGMTSQEVHKHLAISIRTVENHVHNIKQKLGVSKRSEAIEWLRLGCAQGVGSLPLGG